jgi:hypothetical protein
MKLNRQQNNEVENLTHQWAMHTYFKKRLKFVWKVKGATTTITTTAKVNIKNQKDQTLYIYKDSLFFNQNCSLIQRAIKC